ncbi:hypothetical protein [Actinomadura sp. J1-007]|uniref:hypothetical protein n=1 Tax=Actinomadura sp. J1-007 TaxID=2661913 RepID=UPI001F4F7B58|nr:hypothetical protein [Actinomadura sp. J1-007]
MSSLALKQSCSSMTSTSSIATCASSIALRAARCEQPNPTTWMDEWSSKLSGVSVAMWCPAISTAWSPRPCSSTKRSLTTSAAAAPSEVGEHWSLVSGSKIIVAFRTSSREYSSWNCAYGLCTECLWFFHPIHA